jgi:hypothetical protein
MNDFSEARDIIATLLIVGAAIALMVGLSPIEARPLTIFALLLAAGLGIAKRRILATAAAFGVLVANACGRFGVRWISLSRYQARPYFA